MTNRVRTVGLSPAGTGRRFVVLQPLGDGSDPEVVLRDCADDDVRLRCVLCELREAVLEQVGKDQTDRLRHALADALNAISA
jgi:hypothetical protein